MTDKRLREIIRKCKTEEELTQCLKENSPEFMVKRRGEYQMADFTDIYIQDNGRVKVLISPNWSCSFRSIKEFSYNIKLVKY